MSENNGLRKIVLDLETCRNRQPERGDVVCKVG